MLAFLSNWHAVAIRAVRSRVRDARRRIKFFNLPNPSSQKEKKVFLENRSQPWREADKPTAISEPVAYKIYNPQHLI
jgi:hypothetical protein